MSNLNRADHPQRRHLALISVHGDPLLPLGAEEAGGQNVYVREVARALAARGHAVDVFTRGRDCREIEIHPWAGARIIRLPAGPRGFISRQHLFAHLPEFRGHLAEFARWSGARYDVVHSNYWLSGWVGMQLQAQWGLPLTHTHHSLGAVKYASEGRMPRTGATRLQIEERLGARCEALIATSPQEAADMRRLYEVRRPIEVVPCGIDVETYHPRDKRLARRELGLPDDVQLLAYAGRFDPRKGIDTMVRALRLLTERPVHLVLAGGTDRATADVAEYERIVHLVHELGLGGQVTFLGRQAPQRLALVYAAADLCVVPSHYEPFGLVAIEAMGCGTPVVASRVGGLQYTVEDGETGLLVPPRDPEALAEACSSLLSDPVRLERMGRRSHERVRRHFTWEAVAERLETLYHAMCAGRRRLEAGA